MPADHEAELDAGIDDARIYAEQAINSLGQAITNYPGEPMLSSARVCLADAIKLHARGDHELARHRADHGLRYVVGFSADELRPPGDAGEPLDEQRRRLPDTPAAPTSIHYDESGRLRTAAEVTRVFNAQRARRANDQIADELEAPEFAAALTAVESITDTHSQLALVLVELERVNAELEEERAHRSTLVGELARRAGQIERLLAELERCQLGDYPPPVQSITTQEDH